MRIVHVSYAHITGYSDPDSWLKRINFFVVLMEEMAKGADVKSIHCINYSGILNRNGVEYHFIHQTKFQSWFPTKLNRYLGDLKPDVVVVHGLLYAWQVLCLRWQLPGSVRIVIQHHSEAPLKRYKGVLQKLVDRFVPAYFFPSLDQARPWVDKRLIATLEKVHEVMEVPSVFYVINREEAQSRTRVVNSKVYLWVGRFDENKDPITLIKAFIRLAKVNPAAYLYVVHQSNELKSEIRKLLSEASDISHQIFLVGKIDHDELLYWYNSADFIISTSHYEGMGVAVSEGFSCGCIPILTDIPPFRAMTENGNCGYLFSPGNAGDLLEKLKVSARMDISAEREKVLLRYRHTMSAEAISKRMLSACKKIMENEGGN